MDIPLTVSGLERVDACPASAVLPQVNQTDEDAARGISIHAFARRVISGMPIAAALALVPNEDWRTTCRFLDFRRSVGDLSNVRAEVPYAWNVETGEVRELVGCTNRQYVVGPDELPGTEDFEGERFDGVPVVGDWKTGFEDVTPAGENAQVSTFARIRAVLRDAPAVEARIVYVRPSGRVRVDEHVFTPYELDDFEDRVRNLVTRARAARAALERGERLDVAPGDHCRYCPAMAACPAFTSLARSMLPTLEQIEGRIATLTPEQGGEAWKKVAVIKTLLERVETSLKALARQQPLPLGNGKELRPNSYRTTQFHASRALTLLHELGATKEQVESCETTDTRTQVRALKVRRLG